MNTLATRFAAPLFLSLLVGVTGCGKGKGAKDPSSVDSSDGSGHAEVGKQAPDLSIQSLNGKGSYSLSSLQGKVVVVDFWATWCGPCKQSFPKLEEMSKKVGDKVEVVGISVDDEKKGVVEFAKEQGVTFAIGWDEGHTIASRWKVGTMPTTFILDASGKVRYIHDGYHDGETNLMAKELTALLDEPTDTKVAKADKVESAPRTESKADAKTETKSDAKADTKSDAVASGEALPVADEKPEPPPPTKKAMKKPGRSGGSKKSTSPKKQAKKKKDAS
jgi:thiol-disulfide isomerase/thioredoxin